MDTVFQPEKGAGLTSPCQLPSGGGMIEERENNHQQKNMQKHSLAHKSVYWMKVISLGLILGFGIQFAKAWTPPTVAPPGGNVSGPLTNGIIPQYKTGMLGVNSTTIPTNALEVGGGGNAYIGGSLFADGGINATSGTVTGVLTSGKVQIVDVVQENTTCLSNGLVAKNSMGLLLSCQGSPLRWKKASGGTNWVDVINKPTDFAPTGTLCGIYTNVAMMEGSAGVGSVVIPCQGAIQSCPAGYQFNAFGQYGSCVKT